MMTRKISIACLIIALPAIAWGRTEVSETQTLDPRQYVSATEWQEFPLNQVVRISAKDDNNPSGWSGTGSFISPKHILTNKHVAKCCGVAGTDMEKYNCVVHDAWGNDMIASVVATSGGTENCKQKKDTKDDWSIIELISTEAIKKHGGTYLDYKSPTEKETVDFRAGFGALRILSDQDIKHIKQAYKTTFFEIPGPVDISLLEGLGLYKTFMENYKNITEKGFLDDCLNDAQKLKIVKNCPIVETDNSRFKHHCFSWGGDSGSPLVKEEKVVALNNSGQMIIIGTKNTKTEDGWEEIMDAGVPTEHIFTESVVKLLDTAKQEYQEKYSDETPSNTQEKKPGQAQSPDLNPEPDTKPVPEPDPKPAPESTQKPDPEPKPNLEPDQDPEPAQEPTPKPESLPSVQPKPTPRQSLDGDFSHVNKARQQQVTKSSAGIAALTTLAAGAVTGTTIAIANAAKKNSANANNGGVTPPDADTVAARQIGGECVADDLPANASAAQYVAVNFPRLVCGGNTPCACAATQCMGEYKLVYKQINGQWESMGYCIKPQSCTTGTWDTDVIDGVEIIKQYGSGFCKI